MEGQPSPQIEPAPEVEKKKVRVEHSRVSDEWPTPAYIFEPLNEEFFFSLDPCATPGNAKCISYFTKEIDGLRQPWYGRVFMNPPYSEIAAWMAKAYREAKGGCLVVCLVPARTDTRWWHRYVQGKATVHFLKGRIKFEGATDPAPFPSALVVYRPPHFIASSLTGPNLFDGG